MWILMAWCLHAYECEVPIFQEFTTQEKCAFAQEVYFKRNAGNNPSVRMVCVPK